MQPAVTLQDAYSQAKTAFAAGEMDRAITVTQYILRYYPHYLDAYLLLGQAYLEQGRGEDAGRFFSHVLSADPQNVLAHVGRAVIAEERGQIDDAIDFYERAFEIDPGIAEVRTELLRLYKSRYGSAGAALRTTPTGLAYVHLRGGLRDSAISELGYVGQARPDRWDIKVALAEALWRSQRLDEAASVATEILSSHSSCVKCHWMLGYIHWAAGRTETGRQNLVDAVALDPSYRVAQAIWAFTPWQLDKAITDTQPALVPAWSPRDTPPAALELVPSPPALDDPAARPRRITAPLNGHGGALGTFGPLHVTEPLAPLPDQATEPKVPPAPLPLDLDWFDEWIAASEPPAPTENKHKEAELGYNLSSEEDKMAPSYKEDDDQGRQFDFDWDRDEIPEYIRPFLVDQTAHATGSPLEKAAPSPAAQAALQADAQPGPWDPVHGELPQPDYGAPAQAADLVFDGGTLPSWMTAESVHTTSFIGVDEPQAGGPSAADLSPVSPDEFDFSGIEPFDFDRSSPPYASQAAAPSSTAAPDMPYRFNDDVDDFIDFLSATSADEALASEAPAASVAAASVPASLSDFDFGFGTDLQPFSIEEVEHVQQAELPAHGVEGPPTSPNGGSPPISFGVQQQAQARPASDLHNASESSTSMFANARKRKQKKEATPAGYSTQQEEEQPVPIGGAAHELAQHAGAPIASVPDATGAEPALATPLESNKTAQEGPPSAAMGTQRAGMVETPPSPSGGGLEELGRHIEANPNDVASRLALAIGYEQRDDVGHAADQYRELIRSRATPAHMLDIVTGNLHNLVMSKPDDPALHRLLGDAYMKQGLFQPAISEYNWLLTNGGR